MTERKTIGLRLSEREREFINTASNALGQAPSEFIRASAIKEALATIKQMRELNQ